jgi:hypothetical protein
MYLIRIVFSWKTWKNIINVIPLLQPLTSFSLANHKKACSKWFVLVLAASIPVLITVLLSPVPNGDLSFWEKMMMKLTDSITVSEQFVYSAGFLAPTLYLVWENFRSISDSANSKPAETPYTTFQKVIRVYRGYGWVLSFSIVILAMTALGFSSIKTGNQTFSQTFLHGILEEYSSCIYIFALYAFYLSIIQDYGPDGDFNDTSNEDEKKVLDGLSARVNKGKQK